MCRNARVGSGQVIQRATSNLMEKNVERILVIRTMTDEQRVVNVGFC